MAIRVLIVDDSRFFRRRVAEMLAGDSRITVIDSAENGQEAVEKAAALRPDVITMDIEMPVLDGIAATKRIMASTPTAILMFSSLTTDGARATLDALDAGAVDFLPKKFEDISRDTEEAKRLLIERVVAVGRQRVARAPAQVSTKPAIPAPAPARPGVKPATSPPNVAQVPAGVARRGPVTSRGNYKLVAIGASTGGPVALQKVLTALPANFALPIVLVQHMPGTFTNAFAQRLDQICNIKVKEAQDGDGLLPGVALLAPGGKQMLVENRAGQLKVRITESEPGQNYKPCVDVTFASIADCVIGGVLAIVLTGMGADGAKGAQKLKQKGGAVWAQDEATCVVYGMPAAVAECGAADQILPLSDIGASLARQG